MHPKGLPSRGQACMCVQKASIVMAMLAYSSKRVV